MRKWKATQNDDQNDDRTMTILLVSESYNLTTGNLNLQASFGRGNTSKVTGCLVNFCRPTKIQVSLDY